MGPYMLHVVAASAPASFLYEVGGTQEAQAPFPIGLLPAKAGGTDQEAQASFNMASFLL